MKYKAAVTALALLIAGAFYFAGRSDAQNNHRTIKSVDRSGLVVPMKVVRAMDSGWTCWLEISPRNHYNTEWICK